MATTSTSEEGGETVPDTERVLPIVAEALSERERQMAAGWSVPLFDENGQVASHG